MCKNFDTTEYLNNGASEKMNQLVEAAEYGDWVKFAYTNADGRQSSVIGQPAFPKIRFNKGTGEIDEQFEIIVKKTKFSDGNGGSRSPLPRMTVSWTYNLATIIGLTACTVAEVKELLGEDPEPGDENLVGGTEFPSSFRYPQVDALISAGVIDLNKELAIASQAAVDRREKDERWGKTPKPLAAARFVPVEEVVVGR